MFNNDLENILYDNEQFNDFSLEPKLLFDCSNYFIENKDCNSLYRGIPRAHLVVV